MYNQYGVLLWIGFYRIIVAELPTISMTKATGMTKTRKFVLFSYNFGNTDQGNKFNNWILLYFNPMLKDGPDLFYKPEPNWAIAIKSTTAALFK